MMRSPGKLSRLLVGCVVMAGVAGCGGDPTEQASPTGTPPPRSAAVSPPPSPSPSVTVPTVEGLEEHLGGLIASTTDPTEWQAGRRPPGVLSCEGSGRITEGMAVRCDWRSQDPEASSGPVFVAVLDDTGRYTFSSRLGGSCRRSSSRRMSRPAPSRAPR